LISAAGSAFKTENESGKWKIIINKGFLSLRLAGG